MKILAVLLLLSESVLASDWTCKPLGSASQALYWGFYLDVSKSGHTTLNKLSCHTAAGCDLLQPYFEGQSVQGNQIQFSDLEGRTFQFATPSSPSPFVAEVLPDGYKFHCEPGENW